MNELRGSARPQCMAQVAAAVGLLVISIAMGVTAARAASLGKLEIVSGLGEPFRGRIDVLDATRHELDTLGARLASESTYRERSMSYGPALQALRFKLAKQRGGRRYIAVTSSQPFGEPVLDLLVDLAWYRGTTTYSYTALVDPAGSDRAPTLAAPSVVAHSTVSAVPHKAKKPAVETVAAAAKDGKRAEDAGIAEQIRQKEEQVAQKQHQLAAAQERISELQRTAQEQEQMLAAVAAEAIANDLRAAAAGPSLTRVSHEISTERPAARQAESAGLLDEPVYLAGGATMLLLGAVVFMRRRRRRVGDIEGDFAVEPALRAAG